MGKFNWKQLKEEAKKKEALNAKETFWTNRILKIVVSLIVFVLIIGSLSVYLYLSRALNAVDPNDPSDIEVVVPIGSTSSDISQILSDHEIIKNPEIFKYYMRSKNIVNLQAGTYIFNRAMDADRVVEVLKSGGVPIQVDVDTKITVIEGMQIKDIAELIETSTPFTKEEVLKLVNDQAFIKGLIKKFPSLLTGIEDIEGLRYQLEGYLFPATYDYIVGTSLESLLTQMVEASNMNYLHLREQVDNHWLTYHQLLALASIVEREGVTTEDRRLIAGVFYNRLDAGMPLQSDITVLYALDQHKEFVTYSDLEVDSPFNLYMYSGITPGPVNSPSLKAIEAVLDPEWSDYYYFVADLDTGDVYYSSTIEEHDALVEKYVNQRQERIENQADSLETEVTSQGE